MKSLSLRAVQELIGEIEWMMDLENQVKDPA
jgi:hypothetical protein